MNIYLGWDLETVPFAPGYQAPHPVCMSRCYEWQGRRCVEIFPTHEVEQRAREALSCESAGHNLIYDLGCLAANMPLLDEILYALEHNLIVDTMIVERFGEIYDGKGRLPLGLSFVCQKYGLPALKKDDVQTSYGPLLWQPLSAYSREQLEYSCDDSVAVHELRKRQGRKWLDSGKVDRADLGEITRRGFWLHVCRCRGIITDPIAIEDLFKVTSHEIANYQEAFTKIGFLRQDGSKNMKAIRQWVYNAYAGAPPMTEESNASKRARKDAAEQGVFKKPFVPQISTTRSTLEESGDKVLEDFAMYGETAAVLNKDIPMLQRGIYEPIHTRWGIAASLRTTSSDPNIQNFRRSSPKQCLQCGKVFHAIEKCCPKCGGTHSRTLIGIRECIVPRPGYCIYSIDHSGLELCTLAQQIVKLLGLRRMADDINSGKDLHSQVGCLIRGMPYDQFRQAYKDGDERAFLERNCGKVYQFGRHGGMGEDTLRYYAKQSYQLDLSPQFCHDLVHSWGPRANPDGAEYLRAIRWLYPSQNGRYQVKCWGSNLVRGNCTYSAAANHPFQHLGAMIESRIGWELMREQMTGKTRDGRASPLGECFMIDFIHDEFVFEVPIRLLDDVDQVCQDRMTRLARPLLPDVMIKAESVAMDRLSKKAKRIERDGKLQVWHYQA